MLVLVLKVSLLKGDEWEDRSWLSGELYLALKISRTLIQAAGKVMQLRRTVPVCVAVAQSRNS